MPPCYVPPSLFLRTIRKIIIECWHHDTMSADARLPARAADRSDPPGPVCTLGLDLGTSSAKAVVLDTGGKVLSQASAGYAVTSTMAGYAESEPAHWWSAVTACAREAVHAAGAQPSAIGLSGQMHGLVMTSREGRTPKLAGRCNLKTGYGLVSLVRSMPSPAMLQPRCSTTCRATAGTLK